MADVAPTEVAREAPEMITVESDAFADGELIPQRYTCDGSSTSPPLKWRGVPDETSQLVVVLEEPEAGEGETLVRWMVAELDPRLTELPENFVPETAQVGENDLGHTDYRGPCPDHGDESRRFVFSVLAVGEPLDVAPHYTAADLVKQLDGNVIARGELVGRYGRTTMSGPTPPSSTV